MGAFAENGRHRIAVLARDGVLPMELGLVHQIFGGAVSPDGALLYDVVTCGLEPGPIRTDADFAVVAAYGIEALRDADTVIIPASHEQDEIEHPLPEPLAKALAGVRPGTRIASICTAAFVLAEAGLLDGRRATTHWQSAEQFRRRYPAVDLDPGVLYVDEGDVLTSAGEASGIDLCLHLVRRDHGPVVANEVARRTVVAPHREGGQAQYIPCPVPDPELSSTTGPTRTWMLERLHEPLTLADLACHAAMSSRSFTRKFRAEVGMSPLEWLTRRRVDRARQLLEDSNLSVDRIASRSGLGTAAAMRKHFAREIGVSPSAYRSTFRGEPSDRGEGR